MRKFKIIFITTPYRLKTRRFHLFFEQTPLPNIELIFALKRRESKMVEREDGMKVMGWGPSCTDEEYEEGVRLLSQRKDAFALNIEGKFSAHDQWLLKKHHECGFVFSGPLLEAQQTIEVLNQQPLQQQHAPRILALENEHMLMKAPDILKHVSLNGLLIGTSYLSEQSQMYDQLGLHKYRSLMRGVAKLADRQGIQPFTTSNYCTFDPEGKGDKNKQYVQEQVEFVSQYDNWGAITRFYKHLEIAQQVQGRLAENKGDSDE